MTISKALKLTQPMREVLASAVVDTHGRVICYAPTRQTREALIRRGAKPHCWYLVLDFWLTMAAVECFVPGQWPDKYIASDISMYGCCIGLTTIPQHRTDAATPALWSRVRAGEMTAELFDQPVGDWTVLKWKFTPVRR